MTTTEFERLVLRSSPYDAPSQDDTSSATKSSSPSLMMLVLIAAIGVLCYARFLFRPSNHGDLLPFTLVVLAESCLIGQALIGLWTILSSGYDPRNFAFHHARRNLYDAGTIVVNGIEEQPAHWPMRLHDEPLTIDVFITTYGEDLTVIRRTVTAAVAMRGLHRTIVLDDGKSHEVAALARELGAEYIRREGNAGAKAGNINHALSMTSGEFFAILDADFEPRPEFLQEMLPHFAEDKVAFVQSPQAYGNLHTLISRGAGYMQSIFYSLIQTGKNRFNAAFCVGTNVIFRRIAIVDIGGIYQKSKSEDIWTSILLHERGWRSVYTPQVLAVGDTPETIEAYTKQQLRWATGGFEILFRHNPLSPRRKFTLDQRLQYLGTSAFYLNGIAPGLLLAVPPLQIYFNLTPVSLDVSTWTWLLSYAGFYFMQIGVALYTIGSFRWETLMLATASFSIYTKAFFNALLRRERAWHVTGGVGVARSPFNYTMPQLLTFVFLALTSVVGVWKAHVTGELALSLVWNVVNTVVLGSFVAVAWRESRAIKRATRGGRRRRAGDGTTRSLATHPRRSHQRGAEVTTGALV
jgi:cellulose synthase (UDP-forming)